MQPSDFECPVFHDTLDGVLPPSCNPSLFGHEEQRRMLARAMSTGTLHHGLVFEGDRGIGKATLAFHLAGMLLSGAAPDDDIGIPNPDPAEATFRQIAQNAHPNLLYLTRQQSDDGKRFKQDIAVGDVRQIHRFLGMSASNAGFRIVIIDAANDLNRNSSNALLKMLEEPPANTLFVLIAHGAGGLLPTIRSRTQTIRFKPLAPADLERAIAAAAPSRSNDSAKLADLARLSGGSVRQALVMDEYGGIELDAAIGALLETAKLDIAAAHKLADVAGARGDDTHDRLLAELLITRVRERARLNARAGDLNAANRFAGFEARLLERRRVAEGYNLNRKQEFLVTIAEAHDLFRALAA